MLHRFRRFGQLRSGVGQIRPEVGRSWLESDNYPDVRRSWASPGGRTTSTLERFSSNIAESCCNPDSTCIRNALQQPNEANTRSHEYQSLPPHNALCRLSRFLAKSASGEPMLLFGGRCSRTRRNGRLAVWPHTEALACQSGRTSLRRRAQPDMQRLVGSSRAPPNACSIADRAASPSWAPIRCIHMRRHPTKIKDLCLAWPCSPSPANTQSNA